MSPVQVCIAGTGIVCALGRDADHTLSAIQKGRSGLAPLTRFNASHAPALPVGQVAGLEDDLDLPVTHRLARMAADQAMGARPQPPDAIVLGVTTGGMATSEIQLKDQCTRPEAYRRHGIGTVAEDLARRYNCTGPVLTVSTACSSGGGAIALAMSMIRTGHYNRILAGGVDSLCRLTYYGFKSLQLIDPLGCRPMDKDRRGMSVAEGAGMLLLNARHDNDTAIRILGAGLSCDAHHPVQPHPDGSGALAAMQAALLDAGLVPEDIDYINLHGTGTIDNDRSEARAVNRLFEHTPPPLSSIKGAIGHSLAASGAIEAVLAAHCIESGITPGNIGCQTPDPQLNVTPVPSSTPGLVRTVLSNSFGFGGNNAALIIGRDRSRGHGATDARDHVNEYPLTLMAGSVITGAGSTILTMERLSNGLACCGRLESETLCRGLPPSAIRRLKRLSQMALALLSDAQSQNKTAIPASVYLGTAWGSLSETDDFLTGLFGSDEKFSSPTDFIGSVHNAAAGQIALMTKATGVNLTLSGGDYSFEQALYCAQLLTAGDDTTIVLGADEAHDRLSPLFDLSVASSPILSDGGGALILKRTSEPIGPRVALKYFATDFHGAPDPKDLITRLGGARQILSKYGMILTGRPAAHKVACRNQFERFIQLTGYSSAIVDYRNLTGEFATSAAVATVFAAHLVRHGDLSGEKAVLILGLGPALTAIEVCPA